MNNKILKSAIFLARIMQIGYSLMIIMFLYLILTTIFDWPLPGNLATEKPQWLYIEFSSAKEIFSGTFNTNYFALRAIVLVSLFIIGLESLIKIINSIKSLEAFKIESVKHFNKIGLVMLLSFILSSIDLSYVDQNLSFTFSFEPQYLLFGFIAWILAEVFKEGNNLWEENQLTV